jgi:hypothetical protein
MKRFLTAAAVFLAGIAGAAGAMNAGADSVQTPTAPQAPKIQVQMLDPSADSGAFNSPTYDVHAAAAARSALPSPRERDAAFSRAGLEPSLQGWDAVERDVLYLRARSLPQTELLKRYPKLDAAALQKLREALPSS